MREIDAGLKAHLNTGATHLCRAWIVRRTDGVVLGFTDHDRALVVDGVNCGAGSSLDATAIERTTGLAVDNSQAIGALSSLGISDQDVEAGKFDGAEVWHWLVNWQDSSQALLQFRGSIGEIRRGDGAFEAELRSLSEVLNKPNGRVYLRQCDRVLGDEKCGVDLLSAGFVAEGPVSVETDRRLVSLNTIEVFANDWFLNGPVTWLSGANVGTKGWIRADKRQSGMRYIELWEETKFPIVNGDLIRIHAGCDKQLKTCGGKFSNIVNFRGFPQMPGEDWSLAHPVQGSNLSGGRRR